MIKEVKYMVNGEIVGAYTGDWEEEYDEFIMAAAYLHRELKKTIDIVEIMPDGSVKELGYY